MGGWVASAHDSLHHCHRTNDNRRLVDATVPRGTFDDDLCYTLAAEALLAGLSGNPMRKQPLQPSIKPDADIWRSAAFFADLESPDNEPEMYVVSFIII